MMSNNTATSTILYLDTRALPAERTAEIKACLDAGYQLIIATTTPALYVSYGCLDVIHAPLGDYTKAEEVILEHIRQKGYRIDGVIAWKDLEVELAVRLNERLGLHGTSREAGQRVRDKVQTRRALAAIQGANPKHREVGNESDFRRALEQIGVPCLLKPAGNSGGRGIYRIDSMDRALAVYQEFIEHNRTSAGDMYKYYRDIALLEEELVGSEHSVSGMVVNNEVITFAIIDKKINRSVPIQYENVTPSHLPENIQAAMLELARAAVKAVGINWCGFHVDMMVTASGPRILEIGGRLGGEFINSHLIPFSRSSVHPYRALLEAVQGRNPFKHDNYNHRAERRAGNRIVTPPGVGVITSVKGAEKVWQHPATRFFMQVRGIGEEMHYPKDKFKAYEIGYIVAECALSQDICAVMDELANLMEVEVSAPAATQTKRAA